MAANLADEGRQLARQVLIIQALVGLIITVAYSAVAGKNAGLSAFYGALICLLPNWLFAFFAFRFSGASKNQLVVRSFSQGAKLKLLLTLILFIVAYNWFNTRVGVLMTSFAVVLVTQWVAILVLFRVRKQ